MHDSVILLAAVFGAQHLNGPAEAELVTRVHDLASLSTERREADSDSGRVSFIPYLSLRHVDEHGYGEEDDHPQVDGTMELVWSLFGSELEYEGRSATVNDEGRLVLRAPEELQDRVAGLLRFLDETINADALVEIDVLELPPDAELELPPARLAAAQALAWIESAAPGARSRYAARLRADGVARIVSARRVPVVYDHDVEIAQGSSIADPIVGMAEVGTRLELRGVPSREGVLLSAIASFGEFLGRIGTRQLDARSSVRTESGPLRVDLDLAVHDPRVLSTSIAFDTLLEPAGALLLDLGVELAEGGRRRIVVLRHVGGELPLERSFRYGKQGAELVLFDLDRFWPPRATARGDLAAGHLVSWFWLSGGPPMQMGAWLAEREAGGVALEMLEEAQQDFLEQHRLGHFHGFHPYDLAFDDMARLADTYAGMRAVLEGQSPAVQVLELSASLQRGGQLVGRARAPVRAGESCVLALGIEGFELGDYDVEVAQEANTSDPQMWFGWDGLALRLTPNFTPGEDLRLRVGGVAMVRDEAFTGARQDRRLNQLDQVVRHQLVLDESVRLRAGEDGVWRATFGDLGDGPNALRVEVELRR